jgi:macrolide transport system ATP-binding/permease protein
MGENVVHALKGVSLTIEDGDFVAILGPSGSGKSTLMHLLGLLDLPQQGSYTVHGREVAHLGEEELAQLRRKEIGFIFQQFNLLPRMTALENVVLPQLYSENKADFEKGKSLLAKVGLGERTEHKTNELSGGQMQRVAIARSLVNDPRVILADEPTGNLDSRSEAEIMGILKDLNSQGITVVIVTHEEEIGAQAKRRIRMRDGLIQTDERLQPIAAPVAAVTPAAQAAVPPSGFLHMLEQVVEHFRQGLAALATNKVRSFLSMLGILIGVGAVITMLAIGEGAQRAVEAQLASLGSDLLILKPGPALVAGVAQDKGAANRLNLGDATIIQEKLPVDDISPNVEGRGQVTYGNRNSNSAVLGTGASYALMHASDPVRGRYFTPEEDSVRSRVAVLGAKVVDRLFGDQNPIGEIIKINKVGFQVIGVLPEKGSSGWKDQDDVVLIPVQTAMHRLLGKDSIDFIDIKAAKDADMDLLQDLVKQLMLSRHKVPIAHREEAFQIGNMADVQAALSESSRTMSLLLASIATISLLVGGIGIMNIMLVSVTERTREIGLRKAVGATPKDVLYQFLIESLVIGVAGGAIGIAVGWIATELVSSWLGWATANSPAAVALSFFFSAGIGIGFGIYPARKAAALNPIEALRYE